MTIREAIAEPTPPAGVQQWLSAHPRFLDWLIVVGYVLGSFLLAAIASVGDSPLWSSPGDLALSLGNIAVVAAALFVRRKLPLAGVLIVALVTLLHPAGSTQLLANNTALLFLMYAVPVYGSVAQGWFAFGLISAASFVKKVVHIWPTRDTCTSSAFNPEFFLALALLVTLLIGINVGNRRRYVAALVERAQMLARDRERLARIAVAEERERIAREMHDIVAHSLSVMIALNEGSLRAKDTAPERAAEAIEKSTETGREALSQIRRLLGVLQTPTEELAPQPTNAQDIAGTITAFEQAGLDVSHEVLGTQPDDDAFNLAIFRIVQEGLTNALRYAGPGARVEIKIAHGPDRSTVTVRDYGKVLFGGEGFANLGSGSGLRVLKERVRMFDGHLEAGPEPDGGWLLAATLNRTSRKAATPNGKGR